jgi:uncharacterized protein (DUF2164 family)
MAEIEFSKAEKDTIVQKIQDYLNDELDIEIGQFDAEFLLDFFSKEVGAYYYNQGLQDARAVISAKLIDVDEAIYEIEKPTKF